MSREDGNCNLTYREGVSWTRDKGRLDNRKAMCLIFVFLRPIPDSKPVFGKGGTVEFPPPYFSPFIIILFNVTIKKIFFKKKLIQTNNNKRSLPGKKWRTEDGSAKRSR